MNRMVGVLKLSFDTKLATNCTWVAGGLPVGEIWRTIWGQSPGRDARKSAEILNSGRVLAGTSPAKTKSFGRFPLYVRPQNFPRTTLPQAGEGGVGRRFCSRSRWSAT